MYSVYTCKNAPILQSKSNIKGESLRATSPFYLTV